MPIEINDGITLADNELETLTFRSLNIREDHIENFIKENIELLVGDETLLIVGQQVRNQERGRSDLVALDQEGNLVLIEIKRDLEDIKARREPFEFQAIRYAANYATMKTIDELVEQVYAPYIERNREKFELSALTPNELGKRKVLEFLNEQHAERTFNQKQRIFLVASDFDPQTLSACAWLVGNQVDISCFKLIPCRMNTQYMLKIEQILPLLVLEDLYVNVAGSKQNKLSTNSADLNKRNRAILPRMDELMKWGLVQPNDILTIRGYEDSHATVLNSKEVEYRGERLKFNDWGKKVTKWSSIGIYEWAYSERLQQTLNAARSNKQLELEKAESAELDDFDDAEVGDA